MIGDEQTRAALRHLTRSERGTSGPDLGNQLGPSGERASTRELWILAAYFAAIVLLADVFNLRLGVELLTLCVLAAAFGITRDGIGFLRDWWFFILALVLWNLGGPIAAESPFKDHPHLAFMLQFDRSLFFGRDPVVLIQSTFAHPGNIGPLDLAAAMVYNLHLPEPFIAGYFLWRLDRAVYFQFAASALILLVLGFATFIVFPAVPPWLPAQQYGDVPGVYNGFSAVLHWHPLPFHGTPLFYVFKFKGDAIAAFPSEHAAFPLLEALAFSRVVRARVMPLFAGWVLFVLFVVVYLGEHWVTDALAGYVYALAIFGFVTFFTESRRLRAG